MDLMEAVSTISNQSKAQWHRIAANTKHPWMNLDLRLSKHVTDLDHDLHSKSYIMII